MTHNILRTGLIMILAGGVAVAGQNAGQQTAPPDTTQQPGVTFRAEVNYVEVDARVVDAQGNFIDGLSQSDFQVFEDGKPQQISVFSLVNIPVERGQRPLFASRPIEPDVTTNASGYSGRVYVIVLDDTHTHPLRASRVKLAARQFVERHMGVNDIAAVVHTSGRADAAQDFTSNPRLLLNAIDRFSGRKLRSSFMGRLEQEQQTRGMREAGERINDPDSAERGYHARTTLDSIKGLADYLAGVRGRRKALVYFSEGIDYDITDPFNNRDAGTVMDSTRAIIAAATRANVAIYGIDVRGLGAGMDDTIEVQSLPDDPTLGLSMSTMQDEVRMGQDSLRVLSEQTGGFAAVNTNDIAGAFERLVAENSSYYVLGYYPANDRRDGRFRNIDVRVNRPGLTVRARRGYVAPRGRAAETRLTGPNDASAELREAMTSPIPVSGLPLAATASVFKGPDRNGSVVVSVLIGGRDLPLVEKDGVFHNDLEVVMIAVDQRGKAYPSERYSVNMTLKPESVARLRTAGFRVVNTLDLPPGRYQLRVAAREANARRAGSILYDIEVPDFLKEPLSISGLALSSMSSSVALTARPKDPLSDLLPGPLSSYREFPQGDEISVFAEVYQAAGRPAQKVELSLEMRPEGGPPVFQMREQRDSSELGGKSGGYGLNARIPLRDVAPGLYVLRLTAQALVGDRPSVTRETIVQVFPSNVPTARTAPVAPAAGAAAVDAPGASASGASGEPLPMTTLNSDMMSGVDRPRQAVVRTAEEWSALWQAHAPGRPAPAVDFSTHMVLAVFLGSRPTAGFNVQITAVRSEGNHLVAEWMERRPSSDQMVAQVITSPSHLVTVPRHAGDVRFLKVEP
jgi:VWFA-related protein